MEFTTTKITLATGSTSQDVDIKVNNSKGVIVGAFITFADRTKLPADIVRGALKDSNGNDLISALGVTEYERRSGGSVLESMIAPLHIEDKVLEFKVTTDTAPAADVIMDIVLVHKPKTCENV